MRRILLAVLLAACGGNAKPAEGPKTEAKETTEGTTTEGKAEKSEHKEPPKVATKYPDPFLEPDCANPQPEGHLADAKKHVAEIRKKHWAELEKCAEEAPPGENVSGEIRTTFRLDPDGVPRCVEAPGAPPSMRGVVNCVVVVYRSFRFPKPKGGSIRVTDGIHLHVEHDEE